SKEEALQRVEPAHVVQLLLPRFDDKDKERARKEGKMLAVGLNAAPGAAVGKAIFTADEAQRLGHGGEAVILVREETNPEDVHGMIAARGVLTARGGATSHAAVVARQFGKVCVAGAENGGLRVNDEEGFFTARDHTVREGDLISIDGTTGEVFEGAIALIEPKFEEEHDLVKLLGWADETRKLEVWANADYPRDAVKAVGYGA